MHRFKAKITSKGQVTLPAGFRKLTGVGAGDVIDLLVDDEGRATLKKRRSVDELVGSLNHLAKRLGRPIQQADIDAAVAEAMEEKEARSRGRNPR
jgi:AbrB family looped-hinge helix DNA binding protein